MLAPGETVFFYPKGETTSHSAKASAVELAGLHIGVKGQELSQHRDFFDVHAFHVMVPTGAPTLALRFDYLPSAGEITPDLPTYRY